MAALVRKIISTPNAPKPGGPYNQAVQINETLYMAGQIGMEPATGELVPGGVTAEAERTIKNLQAVVEAAGGTLDNIVKATVFLQDIKDWPTVNGVYKNYFATHPPARAAYQVAALPKGALVEMEAIAVIGTIQDV